MQSLRLYLLSQFNLAILIGLMFVVFFGFTQQTHAANTVSAAVYQDTDANGTINRVRWTLDENVTACAFEAGDWTVNTASQMNFAITGISCAGNDAFLMIAVTSDANETGAATAPVISYSNSDGDNSVTLTSGAMTAKANQSTTDAAAPVVVSTVPASGAAGISRTASIVITFSEAMDTNFAEGTEFSMSEDPGAFESPSWSGSNSVVTLNMTDMLCGHAYTFTTVEAQIAAADGSPTTLVTTGPVTGDWSFTTISCSTSGIVTPTITGLEYLGPNCTADNSHSFSVTGANISSYLTSSSANFTDGAWADETVDGSLLFDVVLESETELAYFLFKSDSSTSNSYSLEIDDWSEACASATESEIAEETQTTPVSPEVNGDLSSNVIQVEGVSPGDLIVSSTSTAVYYVTEDYTRRVFLNEQTFFTWYSDFDDVITVSASTMAELPLGSSMLPKAGVVLVKIISSPVVYALEASGEATNLREIPDEATAISLYGPSWADYVIDVEPTYYTRFEQGEDMTTESEIDMATMKIRTALVAY